VIGIGVTALLAAVGATSFSSSLDRHQVQAQALVRSWAQHVAGQITDADWVDCASPSTYAGGATGYGPPLAPLPAGFSASVVDVQYWNGSSFSSSCGSDQGAHRVVLRVSAAVSGEPAAEQTLAVVVRRPCVDGSEGSCH
jgi:hypothetical protein